MSGYFHAMAVNNACANERLLRVCSALSEAEFEARRSGFFPSIKLTLNHILTVDWFYLDALQKGGMGRGQVHAMLSGTRHAPPQLDEFLLAEDASLRRAELQALQVSEKEIWRD